MKGLGEPSESLSSKNPGAVHFKSVDRVYIKENESKRFYQDKKVRNYLLLRYLKICAEKIFNGKDGNTMILSRTNKVLNYYSLEEIRRLLLNYLGWKYSDKFEVKTIHGSKGLEEESVIIIEATSDKNPLVHPDNNLFEIFDYGISEVLEEERRLFYVAMTRARKDLIILSEENNPTSYKNEIETLQKDHLVTSHELVDESAPADGYGETNLDNIPF